MAYQLEERFERRLRLAREALRGEEAAQDFFVGKMRERVRVETVVAHEAIEDVGADDHRRRHFDAQSFERFVVRGEERVEERESPRFAADRARAGARERRLGIEYVF